MTADVDARSEVVAINANTLEVEVFNRGVGVVGIDGDVFHAGHVGDEVTLGSLAEISLIPVPMLYSTLALVVKPL